MVGRPEGQQRVIGGLIGGESNKDSQHYLDGWGSGRASWRW